MNCREFVDFLMDYLDGELPDETRTGFQAHIDACPPCLNYLETYRETVRLGRLCADPEGPVPEEAPAELVEAVLEARRRQA